MLCKRVRHRCDEHDHARSSPGALEAAHVLSSIGDGLLRELRLRGNKAGRSLGAGVPAGPARTAEELVLPTLDVGSSLTEVLAQFQHGCVGAKQKQEH